MQIAPLGIGHYPSECSVGPEEGVSRGTLHHSQEPQLEVKDKSESGGGNLLPCIAPL